MARKRILAVASAGGHWVQLSRLSPAFEDHDTRYVTTMAGATPPSSCHPVLMVPDASRSEPLTLLWVAARLLWLVLKFRPQVVVTTGAAPGLLALQIAKLLGIRTAWIDSIANAEELSMSGRLARRYADLWLTQWQHLAATHPKLEYHGSVL